MMGVCYAETCREMTVRVRVLEYRNGAVGLIFSTTLLSSTQSKESDHSQPTEHAKCRYSIIEACGVAYSQPRPNLELKTITRSGVE